jgi:hypothetical protein
MPRHLTRDQIVSAINRGESVGSCSSEPRPTGLRGSSFGLFLEAGLR